MELLTDKDILTLNENVLDDTSFDLVKAIAYSRVKATDKIDPDNYILRIENTNKFSKGNLSGWIGRAKSKKTFALSMFVGAICGGKNMYNKFNPTASGEVICFDTEQSKYDVQVVVKRIKHLAGNDETNLIMYGLRTYSPEQRLLVIEEVLKQRGKSAVTVIVDGIRDLIYNINDAVESTLVMTKLMNWSEIYNVHFACVLHQNKGDGNARGHIGSELENKSETVIRITQDERDVSISYVEEVFGRGKGFEKFAFQINDKGLPEVVDVKHNLGNNNLKEDDLPF